MSVWFVVDSRQPANNKAGCMGHIHQHSRVMSLVFSFVLLVVAFVCVYSTVLFYLAAIMA